MEEPHLASARHQTELRWSAASFHTVLQLALKYYSKYFPDTGLEPAPLPAARASEPIVLPLHRKSHNDFWLEAIYVRIKAHSPLYGHQQEIANLSVHSATRPRPTHPPPPNPRQSPLNLPQDSTNSDQPQPPLHGRTTSCLSTAPNRATVERSAILHSAIVGTQILFEIFSRHRTRTCIPASCEGLRADRPTTTLKKLQRPLVRSDICSNKGSQSFVWSPTRDRKSVCTQRHLSQTDLLSPIKSTPVTAESPSGQHQ